MAKIPTSQRALFVFQGRLGVRNCDVWHATVLLYGSIRGGFKILVGGLILLGGGGPDSKLQNRTSCVSKSGTLLHQLRFVWTGMFLGVTGRVQNTPSPFH